MSNKTCGECKHFSCSDEGRCMDNEWTFCDSDACDKFQPKVITNGDVIRQGENRDFAEYFVYENGAMWSSTLIVDKTFDTYDEAVDASMDYLNAPAESEREDE